MLRRRVHNVSIHKRLIDPWNPFSGVTTTPSRFATRALFPPRALPLTSVPRKPPPALFTRSPLLLAPLKPPSARPAPLNEDHSPNPTNTQTTVSCPLFSSSGAGDGSSMLPCSPYACAIEAVLQPPQREGDTERTTSSSSSTSSSGWGGPLSLRGLVQLLADPQAAGVEEVSLVAFAAMVPKRQLAAVGGRKEWLEAVLGSEHYQACRDTRALRLAGMISLGQWEEHRDRVPISSYSRGLLEQAYYTITRNPKQQQSNEVLAWLSKTIHRAIVEELMPASSSGETASGTLSASQQQLLIPLLTAVASRTGAGEGKGPGTEGVPPSVTGAVAEENTNIASENIMEKSSPTENVEQISKLHKKSASVAGKGSHESHEVEEVVAPPTSRRGKKRHARAAYARIEALEVEDATEAKEDNSAPVKVEEHKATADTSKLSRAAAAAESADAVTAAKDEDDADLREEEEYEEVEEEVEEEVADQDSKTTPNKEEEASAMAPTAGEHSADPEAAKKLERLAELMLSQFNSADGYLHLPEKEIKSDEKNGYVVVIDEDTAQVDPLGLFSTYHAAEVSAESPIEVQALKQTWTAFNHHQVAIEEAADEDTMNFHRQKGVDALVHGALLMRAISRGGEVDLSYAASLPSYGFPLLSSDTRPFGAKRPRSSLHTDMSFMSVDAAGLAFKKYFAKREVRATPFRPKVDFNAGCGVVQLVGSALHLYETTLKDTIQEEEMRLRFAEALLGVLSLVRNKVLPRLNLVEYHMMVTSLSSSAAAGGEYADHEEIMSPTTIVSIDLTGPFTNVERTRLEALGEPLGLNAEEMHEFTCVDDIISELGHAGVSVVHDLLQNRDDLESLLTPTLVELLPDEGASDVNEDEEGELAPEEEKELNAEEVEEEEEEVEMVEEEEEEEDMTTAAPPVAAGTTSPSPVSKKENLPTMGAGHPHNGSNRLRKGSGAAAAAREAVDELGGEEDELYRRMLEEELEEAAEKGAVGKVTPPPASRGNTSSHAKMASSAAAARAGQQPAATQEEIEEVEEIEEEEEEEVVRAPVLPRAMPSRKVVPSPAVTPSRRVPRVAPTPMQRVGVKVDANRQEHIAEGSEKNATAAAPSTQPLSRRSTGSISAQQQQQSEGVAMPGGGLANPPLRRIPSRIVSSALEENATDRYDEETPRVGHPARDQIAPAREPSPVRSSSAESQEQWFKKKPKRRHFP